MLWGILGYGTGTLTLAVPLPRRHRRRDRHRHEDGRGRRARDASQTSIAAATSRSGSAPTSLGRKPSRRPRQASRAGTSKRLKSARSAPGSRWTARGPGNSTRAARSPRRSSSGCATTRAMPRPDSGSRPAPDCATWMRQPVSRSKRACDGSSSTRTTGTRSGGASAAMTLASDRSGRGFALRIAPSWGSTASEVERLWSADTARFSRDAQYDNEGALQTELSYGVRSPLGRGGRVALRRTRAHRQR